MPELRQDPTTKEWIVIATERARRPHDFRAAAQRAPQPAYDETCPFCPGHEAATPPEVLARREHGAANEPGWSVRVVPNRFAALLPEGSTDRRLERDFYRWMDGVGYHEVIVETPVHNRPMAHMERGEVQAILEAYRDRYLAMCADRRVEHVLIFKNYGEAAGTSLLHPHSQLVATPVVPAHIRLRNEEAIRYMDATGHCLYCDLIDTERRAGERVLFETPEFIVIHPFASGSPFETWILPKRHQSVYGQVRMEQLTDLAGVLQGVLARMSDLLNDPDYNYVLQSAPTDAEDEDYYHWHVQVMPRLTRIAGFEIGSGMRINTARPEDTARFWRG
jgi:UDPglucose--hexose-1-phosphate uridylyltransferase